MSSSSYDAAGYLRTVKVLAGALMSALVVVGIAVFFVLHGKPDLLGAFGLR